LTGDVEIQGCLEASSKSDYWCLGSEPTGADVALTELGEYHGGRCAIDVLDALGGIVRKFN